MALTRNPWQWAPWIFCDRFVRTSKDSLQFLLTNPERTRLHCTIGYWKLVSATNFSGPAFHAEQCCKCGSAKSQQKDVKSSKIVKIRAWLKEFKSCHASLDAANNFDPVVKGVNRKHKELMMMMMMMMTTKMIDDQWWMMMHTMSCLQVWCDKESLQISLGIRTNLG